MLTFEGDSLADHYASRREFELVTVLDDVEAWIRMSLDKTLSKDFKSAIYSAIEYGLEYVGHGTNRICFSYGEDYIIKLPLNGLGLKASADEAEAYELFDDGEGIIPIAECYMKQLHFIDFEVLVMERLRSFPFPEEILPEWVESVDNFQVGYNSIGDLVAYDL